MSIKFTKNKPIFLEKKKREVDKDRGVGGGKEEEKNKKNHFILFYGGG